MIKPSITLPIAKADESVSVTFLRQGAAARRRGHTDAQTVARSAEQDVSPVLFATQPARGARPPARAAARAFSEPKVLSSTSCSRAASFTQQVKTSWHISSSKGGSEGATGCWNRPGRCRRGPGGAGAGHGDAGLACQFTVRRARADRPRSSRSSRRAWIVGARGDIGFRLFGPVSFDEARTSGALMRLRRRPYARAGAPSSGKRA